MNIGAVIPARYDSSRFPGKPLALINGIPMIRMVYERVYKSGLFSKVLVATDDKRIFNLVKNFGGDSVMTSSSCISGTDRVWEAVKKLDFDAVVNVQGDEPLISAKLLSSVSKQLSEESEGVQTAAFLNKSFKDFLSNNSVKVVLDLSGHALYFSRAPIPFQKKESFSGFLHHVGIYGYHVKDLKTFVGIPRSKLEVKENLEQLRLLENGIVVRVIKTDYRSFGVDSPDDLKKIEILTGGNSN